MAAKEPAPQDKRIADLLKGGLNRMRVIFRY